MVTLGILGGFAQIVAWVLHIFQCNLNLMINIKKRAPMAPQYFFLLPFGT